MVRGPFELNEYSYQKLTEDFSDSRIADAHPLTKV